MTTNRIWPSVVCDYGWAGLGDLATILDSCEQVAGRWREEPFCRNFRPPAFPGSTALAVVDAGERGIAAMPPV